MFNAISLYKTKKYRCNQYGTIFPILIYSHLHNSFLGPFLVLVIPYYCIPSIYIVPVMCITGFHPIDTSKYFISAKVRQKRKKPEGGISAKLYCLEFLFIQI